MSGRNGLEFAIITYEKHFFFTFFALSQFIYNYFFKTA